MGLSIMVYWHGVIDYGVLAWGYPLWYIGMGLSIMVHWHGVIDYGILAWGNRLWYIGMGLSIMVYWHGVIDYGILAWGYRAQRIYKLNKAIRIITSGKYNAHTEPIYKELKLLKVSDIYKLQELKFYHKFISKQPLEYFNNMPYTQTSEVHQ